MAKIQVSELTGSALKWAVAMCDGHTVYLRHDFMKARHAHLKSEADLTWHLQVQSNDLIIGDITTGITHPCPNYLEDGGGGILIIEREGIDPDPMLDENNKPIHWVCFINREGKTIDGHGPTLLIAAMRCYVTSKMGDTIDVPEELIR